jgi:hypothetical protein
MIFAMFTYDLKIIKNKILKLFVLSVAVVRTRTVLSLVREMTSTKILTVCKTKIHLNATKFGIEIILIY